MSPSTAERLPARNFWPTVAEADAGAFREAARKLPNGVSIVTFGAGKDRAGLTATSVSILGAEPPMVLLCVDRLSPAYPLLARERAFAVNVLAADQRELAERFGAARLSPAQRFADGRWLSLPSGIPCLADGLVAFDCELVEAIERGAQALLMGRVRCVLNGGGSGALLSWRGAYEQVGWSNDEISRAIGVTPRAGRRRDLDCPEATPCVLRQG